jgi:hypothetical protein
MTRNELTSQTDNTIADTPRLLALVACALLPAVALADTLHAIGNGAFQHHDSGWVFPRQIGEFVRVGAPQDVDGTIDVVAHYAQSTHGNRMTAIVDIYPADSAAPEASYEKAQDALALGSKSASIVSSSIAIETSPPLKVAKSVLQPIDAEAGTHMALYLADTGQWIVKIRTHAATNAATSELIDGFVRQQRWDSLALTNETCTGPACAREALNHD